MLLRLAAEREADQDGLGPAELIGLARAKELALRHRLAIIEGRDPLAERRAARPVRENVLSFRQVAELYIGGAMRLDAQPEASGAMAGDARNLCLSGARRSRGEQGRHRRGHAGARTERWRHKAPRLGGGVPETAGSRSAQPVIGTGARSAQRPGIGGKATTRPGGKGTSKTCCPNAPRCEPWSTTPRSVAAPLPALLWAELAERDDISALALRLTLLTAVRTNEALGAVWGEIDPAGKVWTIPAARMKAAREFRVPLSTAATAVLDELAALRQGEHVFPGARVGKPLSNMAMLMALRRLRPGMTTHGTVRSGFRDWASEAGIAGEVAEGCLAHTIANKVEAAYRRGDLLKPRRAAMERWARFLTTPIAAPAVVALRGRATG